MQRTTAPLDLASVERVLQPYDRARTLPADAYASPEVFAWEQRHLFEGSWMCIGRTADLDLGAPGSQAAVAVGDHSFLLVRGDDRRLRAFHNVCRHRGHELLAVGERRSQRGIRCPYHAWVYGLEGDLRATPRFNMDSLDKGEFPLVDARVEEWHGWLFCNASGDAPELATHLGNLEIVVDGYRPEDLVLGASHAYELAANWKIAIENYCECYHCSEIHPELCKVTPPDSDVSYPERSTGVWIGGPMELLDHAVTMSLTGASDGTMIPGLPEDKRRVVGYSVVYPNLLISPHPDYVMTHRLVPLAPVARGSSAPGISPPRPWRSRASAPTTPPSSGTSRTARTGPRVSRSSATSRRRGTVRARSRTGRSTSSAHRRSSPGPIWKGICRLRSMASSTASVAG